MKTPKQLIIDATEAIHLNILVFGPQVSNPSTCERTTALQNKRLEIRANLEEAGHNVKFAEDIVDNEVSGPLGNPAFQEVLIMQDYDVVVVLVESPGSIVEATLISMHPNLAQKAVLFFDEEHAEGLVANGPVEQAKTLGAIANTFRYPEDLLECHLLGHVKESVDRRKLSAYLQ